MYDVTEAVLSVEKGFAVAGSIVVIVHSVRNLKPNRWTCNIVWFRSLEFTSSNLAITLNIICLITKNIYFAKGEGTVDHTIVSRWLKKFRSTIRQDQVGLELWVLRLCSKPKRHIQRVTLKEYQESSASHSSVWFITFTISAKALGAAELWRTNYQNIAILFTHPCIKNYSMKKGKCNCSR